MKALAHRRVLLVVSGGISAYKAPLVLRALQAAGAEVRCALTAHAQHFVSPLVLETLSGQPVRSSLFETHGEGEPGERAEGTHPRESAAGKRAQSQIEHLDLVRWADAVLVAPATANLLAKMASGIADDLCSTLLLAARCPIVLVPAMNCDMLEHPATQRNLAQLAAWGHTIVEPDEGELACKVVGKGRQPDPDVLVEALAARLSPKPLAGKRVLVSAGSTREALDPVRFIANPSSGKMGVALARAAAWAGAEVELVCGPAVLAPPPQPRLEVVRVESALDLHNAIQARLDSLDWLWMAAAVGDWQAAQPLTQKRKKNAELSDERWQLELVRTPDCLAAACAWRRELPERAARLRIIGFAAETHELERHASDKLARKGCDVVLANWVRSPQGDAFAADAVELHAFAADGWRRRFGPGDKLDLAFELVSSFAAQEPWPPRGNHD